MNITLRDLTLLTSQQITALSAAAVALLITAIVV